MFILANKLKLKNKMKNPFKSFVLFVILIVLMAFLGSCQSTHRGFNYQAHQKKSHQVMKKAYRVNKGNQLTQYRCTNRH
jgi:hypothetical protein